MCADNQHWSSSLEAYTSLDTDNRITHVAVTADGIRRTDFLNLLDGLHLIVILHTVYAADFTLLESDLQQFGSLFGRMFQESAFRQSLVAVEQLAATD